LSGSATGRTFTTNGVSLSSSSVILSGFGCGWSLGSAITCASLNTYIGSLDTAGYSVTASQLTLSVDITDNGLKGASTLTLGSSVITLSNGNPFSVGFKNDSVFNSDTSQINLTANTVTIPASANNPVFYNVSFTNTGLLGPTIAGTNTFNNLTFTGRTTAGIAAISLSADQTINGTLTFSTPTNSTCRHFVQSNTIGTTRTLTCAAFSGTDVDFRDITIAGAAAPVSGTRFGDCKGNSGITFDAPKTVYFRSAASANWGSDAWSATSNGSLDLTQFPLAQDTAVFPVSPAVYPTSGNTVTVNAAYNIGTIDMSARIASTMTLATGSTTPAIYGNWINGTGTTLTGSGQMAFAGRGSQTITSAGRTFTQGFTIATPGGSVTLQDALTTSAGNSAAIAVSSGTFDAATYNVTLSSTGSGFSLVDASINKTVAIGSGTLTIVGSNGWNAGASTNATITGTGTINLTSTSSKTFVGSGLNYSGITLNQGGAGTLTITGDNTFANITKTVGTATTIALAATTQRVSNFTASGSAGNLLTITGTSAASPATIIYTGGSTVSQSYIVPTNVRVYPLTSTWTASDSTNGGSLGYTFAAAPPPPVIISSGNFFLLF